MSEKGVSRPSRREPRKNAGEPGGVRILPGTYKIVMKFDEQEDNSSITVHSDPRMNVSMDILKAHYDFFIKVQIDTEVAAKAMAQLRESNNTIGGILKQLKDRKGDDYDSLKKNSNTVKDSIKVLVNKLLGAESKKQGIVSDPNTNIMQYYRGAGMYMGSSLQMPGPTEERLYKQGHDKLLPWLEEVNEFFKTEWPKYQEQVKQTDLSPFKEINTFELK
jgi:hypothetical protein